VDYRTLFEIVDSVGTLGVIVYLIIAIMKGWIIPGREHQNEIARRKELERERNDWRELALRGTSLAEGLAQVSTRRVFEKE